MAYSIPHSDDEIQALVQKQIDEDMVHQKAILDLALQFDNACTTKEDLRKAYEKYNHIPQESRTLIDTFLKEGSDKDYELNLSMYRKAAKLEKEINAKLAWIHEKYNHRSKTHIGGSSSQTYEIGDVYLIAKELHQLHLDEEALRETLKEQTMDEKALEGKIRQKQADDDEYFMEFVVMRIDSDYDLDIDDSDLHLTPVLRSSSGAHVEPSPYISNPVTIIQGPADGALMSTQEYMQKVVEDEGEDANFNSGAWVSATNCVNAFGGTITGCLGDIDNFLKKRKLEQVVAIVKSCSPNALGDLNVTLKDLSGTVPGTIHYKVLDVGSYEKDIIVGAAMILANVSVFTHKPSKYYLNITKRNVVEVTIILQAKALDLSFRIQHYFLLSLLLALGFLPLGTSLVGEEYLGALESTGTSRLQMAFMWSVKECTLGKKGFGLSRLSRVTGSSLGLMPGDDDSTFFE
uniref:Homologous recombination OB-fold protein OB-fold domain-containing protein n=1 Tax=Tanacetum cinerariifolium TaxID=118510 RepID=A0A6L2MMR5_TANCI|nr:hypothetical protein [Tanacetum cinerariifolium]